MTENTKPNLGVYTDEDMGYLEKTWLAPKLYFCFFSNKSKLNHVIAITLAPLLYAAVYTLVYSSNIDAMFVTFDSRGTALYTALPITALYLVVQTVRARGGPYLNGIIMIAISSVGDQIMFPILSGKPIVSFHENLLSVLLLLLVFFITPIEIVGYYYRKYNPEALHRWAEENMPYQDQIYSIKEGKIP